MKEIGYEVINLVSNGFTYRQVMEKTGLKSTNSVSHYVRQFNGKRIYLTETERLVIKKIIGELRVYQDDGNTHKITNSILSKL